MTSARNNILFCFLTTSVFINFHFFYDYYFIWVRYGNECVVILFSFLYQLSTVLKCLSFSYKYGWMFERVCVFTIIRLGEYASLVSNIFRKQQQKNETIFLYKNINSQ